jgi:hypothetical protein
VTSSNSDRIYELLKSTQQGTKGIITNAMTELKEMTKSRKFTPIETNMRNSMLKKLHESGDFDRCVLVLPLPVRGLNLVICTTMLAIHLCRIFRLYLALSRFRVAFPSPAAICVFCVWPTCISFLLLEVLRIRCGQHKFKNKHPFENKHNPIV